MVIDELIDKWRGTAGGAETSNFQSFITDICEVLELDRPGVAEKGRLGSYEYEASIPGGSFRSTKGTGAIDLYKRGHFIMEAKQSYLKPEQVPLDLDDESVPQAPSGARYDKLMKEAWLQARNYARNLPSAEPVSPFLIVCDVGRAFELYVDPAGNGRDYEFFPDRQSYRIELSDLASNEEVARTEKTPRELLRAIWTAPKSVDPRFHAAEVTRSIAKTLAEVMEHLEEDQKYRLRDVEDSELRSSVVEETSLFLMRILFCMFAEDIELLPEKSFQKFLESCLISEEEPDNPNPIDQNQFRSGLERLWSIMGHAGGDRRSLILRADIRYFNGQLFENSKTFPIHSNDLEKLIAAAKSNWRRVEPAIFGTLLEQALDTKERSKLGAHYTPRPYVERLVRATIMDVLEPEWEAIEALDDQAELLAQAKAFHDKLVNTRVLDPACGTGNFLYVAMELLQGLESKVIERIQTLGEEARPRVGPQQFYGLEINPRAAKIAELVLWIGWLRNRLKDDPDDVPEPVLKRSANLNMGRRGRYDAILRLTDTGEPDFESPVLAEWPEAEFIIGNPPFIGGKDIRERLGGDYAEAMWATNTRVAKSADFVMQWWDRAAHVLVSDGSELKRFGFVTTNSITQEFSRRVIAQYLGDDGGGGLSLVMAIPDHPWTKATKDAAAVRIAMTVAELGEREGTLLEVTSETKLDSDHPDVALADVAGAINANLTVGADVTSAKPLLANEGVCSRGLSLHGKGFLLEESEIEILALKQREDWEKVLLPYRNGRDLLQRPRGVKVIDLFGKSEREVRQAFPEIYQHLMNTVYKQRLEQVQKKKREGKKPTADSLQYLEKWWLHGKPRQSIRPALQEISRYIATVETAKFRIFEFVSLPTLCDNAVWMIASDSPYILGVLSSKVGKSWIRATGGTLEDRPKFTKGSSFDPFPFPDPTDEQRAAIAELAEELDETRKLAIEETDKLTMTELYNLREKLRSGEPMSDKDQRRATGARAGIVNRLHEQLDQAVADAYGWGEEWAAGALGPSEIVARLVALNHERAEEERNGHIRWLRPDYQIPRFAPKS